MKQDFAFAAARPLARHCAALLRPRPDDADAVDADGHAALRLAAARLARSLRGALARLCGGEPPEVAIDPPQEMRFADFAHEGLCVYTTYSAAPGGEPLLGAIDAGAVLRLVDRAFGGPGEVPRALPRELPMSADLMVQRIETILAAQIALALGGAEGARIAVHPQRRDSDLAQLQPFAPQTRLAVLTIAVSEGTRASWLIRLALPVQALPVLTGMAAPAGAGRDRAAPFDPDAEPFAALPLRLTARLVDTRLPLQAVSQLAAGQVLSLPIARQVPLIAGRHGVRRTVGHGTIGAVDDRVAIQITRLF